MPSADQVPVNRSHSTMRWHKWVVLIAGSTGSALRAVRPPNLHITPNVRRDLVYAASATGSLWRSPLAIMPQGHARARAMAATLVVERADWKCFDQKVQKTFNCAMVRGAWQQFQY